jgi:hypothetical protein
MKIVGWILTIIGGVLSFGALISLTKPDFVLDGPVFGAIAISVALFVIGLVILNNHKKQK